MNDYLKRQNYFTQKELATRWRVSQGTIINLRKAGNIPFFSLPGSSKILYPVDEIIDCEQKHTTAIKEVHNKRHQLTELKRKLPVVSPKKQQNWRI
ncbi:helix-turn-helix domain-containing protein [Desulfopila inferna]|uniref:helix-turn-helix domain-containing protein n=1 Tax=Desulfopila inferna TaxID=468528 RepID=UPI001965D726|nr:helix-turn-helix domain-containing protein [Desulfopila inferna]MBM9604214.1 DNA-binding protein [Desulfopila inferna]